MPVQSCRAALLAAAALSVTLPGVAHAGSIATAGYTAGPDSTAATPNPAAPLYNPAALGGTTGLRFMADSQVTFIRVDIDSTRQSPYDIAPGIDPNTGQPYRLAQARVRVPNVLLGVSWKAIPDRLAFGLSVNDTFVGGGDYTHNEPDRELPFTGHQRYFGVTTKVITIHMVPAVAVTTVEGVHVGAGLKVIYDSISAIQAADPFHSEGVLQNEVDQVEAGAYPLDDPYAADTYLTGEGSGWHLGWNAGIYIDRWDFARVGVSYTHNGTFQGDGEATVNIPGYLNLQGDGRRDVPADVSFDYPLPPVIQGWVNSDINDQLTVGAGVEYQLWNVCCGEADGDIAIDLTSKDGDALGQDDGIAISVADKQFSARRLWNSANYAVNGGYRFSDPVWVGAKVGYQQNAVPDYSVSATNLDFKSIGAQGAFRYRFGKDERFTVGLSYSKFFTFERTITDSAWDRGDGNPRFTPGPPFKASANGVYRSKADTVGLRLAARL